MSRMQREWAILAVVLAFVVWPVAARAQENLVANPGFENLVPSGFFSDWGQGSPDKVGKIWFVDRETKFGKQCLRMQGVPNAFTTCPGRAIAVQPNREYWISWQVRAQQPATGRVYLFLQTNLAQRVFSQTDRNGPCDWTQNIVRYRTKPDETSLQVVLTMQTIDDTPAMSWWDDVGVWERLPTELAEVYRKEHPWDDVTAVTAQRLAQTPDCEIWGDRAEVRIGPKTPIPARAGKSPKIRLTAPGVGHDVYQLVIAPTAPLPPISLEFSGIRGPDKMPASSLAYRVVRCVPVEETRDKTFPHGPTPDPLVEVSRPEPVKADENLVFWIEWAPPAKTAPGDYTTELTIRSGKKPLATVGLELRRWGFDLPATPQFGSMVTVSASFLQRFYAGKSEEDVLRLAWRLLSSHRLSGFNMAWWPTVELKDGKPVIDWVRFDQLLRLAREFRPTAVTIGPMFGGGCSQGWVPHKFAGLTPLEDERFAPLYVQYHRSVIDRLRMYNLYDRAYFYPYDEPEPDYMPKIARLFDLIRQADPSAKCMATVDPQIAGPIWGKTGAWCIPWTTLKPEILEHCRQLGDEVWVYNMTASIEDSPLSHRQFMWRAFRAHARGGLLWNSNWWNKINPWENPTAAPVPVGRKSESLYRYQAGQASLFYPDKAGKGPLVPSLRLVLIRQGVEDFDILTQLATAQDKLQARLSENGRKAKAAAVAREALVAPVMFDLINGTACPARLEAMRGIAGSELEVATQEPSVIAYPGRTADGRLGVMGYAEVGTHLTLSGHDVTLDDDGRFEVPLAAEELARGLQWTAEKEGLKVVEKVVEKTTEKGVQKVTEKVSEKGINRKSWRWPGLR